VARRVQKRDLRTRRENNCEIKPGTREREREKEREGRKGERGGEGEGERARGPL